MKKQKMAEKRRGRYSRTPIVAEGKDSELETITLAN